MDREEALKHLLDGKIVKFKDKDGVVNHIMYDLSREFPIRLVYKDTYERNELKNLSKDIEYELCTKMVEKYQYIVKLTDGRYILTYKHYSNEDDVIENYETNMYGRLDSSYIPIRIPQTVKEFWE